MKKLVSLLVALLLLTSAALAGDTGVSIIGGPDSYYTNGYFQPITVDDVVFDCPYSVQGFGTIEFYNVEWMDAFISANPDGTRDYDYNFESGSNCEFLRISLKITNTTNRAIDYLPMIQNIVCTCTDGYMYGGWTRQRLITAEDGGMVYMDAYTSYAIQPCSTGRYVVCVTLPNSRMDIRQTLAVSFNINENQFTCYLY